jgi:hypothetical protein
MTLGAESRFKGDNGALKVGEVVGYREVPGWLDFLLDLLFTGTSNANVSNEVSLQRNGVTEAISKKASVPRSLRRYADPSCSVCPVSGFQIFLLSYGNRNTIAVGIKGPASVLYCDRPGIY